jgi:hypothetical protein
MLGQPGAVAGRLDDARSADLVAGMLKFRARNQHKMAPMICPTCQYSIRPGFLMTVADGSRFSPCPTCDGSRIASCCDGAVPCDEDVIDQRAAVDDAIYRQAKGDPDMLARRILNGRGIDGARH